MVFSNTVLPLAASLLFASAASAQVALYDQCGGTGFTGGTTCASGAICQVQNVFYSQCVPSTGAASSVVAVPSSASLNATSVPVVVAASSAPASSSSSSSIKCTKKASTTAMSTLSTVASSAPVASTATEVSTVAEISTSAVVSAVAVASTPVVAAVATSAAASTVASTAASSGTKYLMIFGDSYSSDGFYGGATLPSADAPLGVASPGTTTDGGLNWVGVTATSLNTSLTLAFDYAEYGATTDNTLVNGATDDLIAQVTEFQTYAVDAGWTADNTMAIVWMGINDVGNSYWDGFETPFDEVLDQYFTQLQNLYDAGITYFTLFTVPPFDQAPVFASETAQNMDYVRSNITTYNEDLVTRLATFEAANSGVVGTIFNTTASFYTVLDSPSTYGSADATCMNADGTTCLWYDTYHPGQAIQKLVAQNFVAALTGTFF